MRNLQSFRDGKPGHYPDQTIYAEYACAAFGLTFEDLDGGTGLIFKIASAAASHCFGGGRCSFFPQNNATAATLASDKFFTNRILDHAGIPTLGGDYFFLHDRHHAHRAPGHERSDASTYFATLRGTAFVKPLNGSRGDFAQPIHDAETLARYMDDVAQFYDAILIQPYVRGKEYRIFLLDDDVIYSVHKQHPFIEGDGIHSIRDLLARSGQQLISHGISPAALHVANADRVDVVLPAGERRELIGRTNRSAGGIMTFDAPDNMQAALARQAMRALGLRAAAVDLFTEVDGDPDAMRIIEINANPSIRFLEDSNRPDLILTIWRHSLTAIGLLRV